MANSRSSELTLDEIASAQTALNELIGAQPDLKGLKYRIEPTEKESTSQEEPTFQFQLYLTNDWQPININLIKNYFGKMGFSTSSSNQSTSDHYSEGSQYTFAIKNPQAVKRIPELCERIKKGEQFPDPNKAITKKQYLVYLQASILEQKAAWARLGSGAWGPKTPKNVKELTVILEKLPQEPSAEEIGEAFRKVKLIIDKLIPSEQSLLSGERNTETRNRYREFRTNILKVDEKLDTAYNPDLIATVIQPPLHLTRIHKI